MNFTEQLRQEIAEYVSTLVNQEMDPAWVTNAICGRHIEGLNSGSNESMFWRHHGYGTVRREVGKYLTKYFGDNPETDDDKQRSLPGYDHVQTHYIVTRSHGDIAIPTQMLTDEEIDGIIARQRATGAALFAHADELERFKERRSTRSLFAAE